MARYRITKEFIPIDEYGFGDYFYQIQSKSGTFTHTGYMITLSSCIKAKQRLIQQDKQLTNTEKTK